MPPHLAQPHSPDNRNTPHATPPSWTQGATAEHHTGFHTHHYPHIYTSGHYRPRQPSTTTLHPLTLIASGISFLQLLLVILSISILARESTGAEMLIPAAPLVVRQAINVACIIQVVMRRTPSLIVANAALSLSSFLSSLFYIVDLGAYTADSLTPAAIIYSITLTIMTLLEAAPWTIAGAVAIFSNKDREHPRSLIMASGAAATPLVTQFYAITTTILIASLCPHPLDYSCATADISSLKYWAIPATTIVASTAVLVMVARKHSLLLIRAGMVVLTILAIANIITYHMFDYYAGQLILPLFSSIPLISLAAAVFLPSFKAWITTGGQHPQHTTPPGTQAPSSPAKPN